jgi:hypothetical protein
MEGGSWAGRLVDLRQGRDDALTGDLCGYYPGMRRVALLASVLALLAVLATGTATAKPEYTRRTSKDCSFCHMPPGYNLNDAGKYYQEHQHSLKGYVPAKPKAAP